MHTNSTGLANMSRLHKTANPVGEKFEKKKDEKRMTVKKKDDEIVSFAKKSLETAPSAFMEPTRGEGGKTADGKTFNPVKHWRKVNDKIKQDNPATTPVVRFKESNQLQSNASQLGGALDTLRQTLDDLDFQIKADKRGLSDYDEQIHVLQKQRDEIERVVSANKETVGAFDMDIGPFIQLYDKLQAELHDLYEGAKVKHADGIRILCEQFDYHPAFKRWSDYITATPFKPL